MFYEPASEYFSETEGGGRETLSKGCRMKSNPEFLKFFSIRVNGPGLPDALFLNQKSQFG
jgi:hypothetical protein